MQDRLRPLTNDEWGFSSNCFVCAKVLAERLAGARGVTEIVRYDVAPSVGAHMGEGSVGVVYAPW